MTLTLFEETGTKPNTATTAKADTTALLDKFASIEINNMTKISPQDKEACEGLQAQYDKLKVHQSKYLDILEKMQEQTSNAVFSLKEYSNGNLSVDIDHYQPWHQKLMFSPLFGIKTIKEKVIAGRSAFIDQITRHFETAYNLDLELHQLEKGEEEIHYTDIVETILQQLDGLSLTGAGIDRLKTEFRRRIHSQNRIQVKNTKVVLSNYIWFDSYSGETKLSYSSSSGAMGKLNLALSFFEQGTTNPLDIIQGYLPHETGDRDVDTSQEYTLEYTEKIKGVRFYKNGRIDLRFKDAETAKEFYDCMELFKLD